MATDYTNPFGNQKNVINLTFPFQRVLESLPKGPGMDFIGEGPAVTPAPTPANSKIQRQVDPRYAAMESAAKQYQAQGGKLTDFLKPTRPTSSSTGGGLGSAAGAAAGKKPSALTDLLRVPGIENIYNPVLEQLKAQEAAANKRYESNAANLKNIFGALSGLAAADQARIKEQFTQSIEASSKAYNDRAAAEKEALAAGIAQARATGAERGAGPEMATNPIEVAAAEGATQAKSYQTTWENLQRANQAQAEQDTRSRGEGYDYQKVAALQGLQQSLEDRLMQIGGNTAQVQSDIAKAKFGQETTIAQAKYSEAIAARNAAAKAAAAANAPKKYAAGIAGFSSKFNDSVGDPTAYNQLVGSYDKAYAAASKNMSPSQIAKGTQPSKAQVLSAWRKQNPGNPYEAAANEYVNRFSGLK